MSERIKNSVGMLLLAAFCLAGGACVVWGFAPAAVALLIVSSALTGLVLLPYICVTAGAALGSLAVPGVPYSEVSLIPGCEYDGAAVLEKYILLLGAVMLTMKLLIIKKKGKHSGAAGGNELWILRRAVVLAAAYAFMANAYAYEGQIKASLVYGALDAASTACMVAMLLPGLRAVYRQEHGQETNELILSLMALTAIVLWVLPGYVYGEVSITVIAGLLCTIYVVHRAGASYGFGMAMVSCGVLGVKEEMGSQAAWVLLAALVMLVGQALAGRRKYVTAGFYVAGVLLGVIAGGSEYMEMTVDEQLSWVVNVGLPVLMFICIPHSLLTSDIRKPDGAYMQAAATEMNRLAVSRMEDMANTFRRLDYTFSGVDEPAISLGRVGELVDVFREQISGLGDTREVVDERLIDRLDSLGMAEVTVTVTPARDGRESYCVSGRTAGTGMVLSRQVAEVLSGYFHKNIRMGMNSPNLFFDEYRTVVYEESAQFKGSYHVRRIKKHGSPVSGDNFSVKEYEDGRLVMMLSDGMGSGSQASCESCMMLDTMEELLEAGFDPEYSISFANGCLSRKNRGRTFTTFDMAVIDMYDGRLSSYKQGASVTYILHRGTEENEIKQISGDTLPVGVLESADCDRADVELAAGDAVIMMSDGISEMDDENRLPEVLRTLRLDDCRKLVDELLGRVIHRDGAVMRDDITVMAVVINEADK